MAKGPDDIRAFNALLGGVGPDSAWTRVMIPFDVEQAFGSKGRVSVAGTLNGFTFRSSIFPNGDGSHHLMVNKALKAGGKVAAGETATFTLAKDTAPREVETPDDLAEALAGDDAARARFEGMAPSHRRAYADWIPGAKRTETRIARIE